MNTLKFVNARADNHAVFSSGAGNRYPTIVSPHGDTLAKLQAMPNIAELIARLDGPLAVLHTATTGLNPLTDRLVSVGIVPGQIDGETFIEGSPSAWRFNPEVPSDPEALRHHGLTEEFLADYPSIDWVHLHDMAAHTHCRTVVTHHAAFDLGFLNAELSRFPCTEPLGLEVIDTRIVSAILWPGENSSLDAMAVRLGIDVSGRSKGIRDAVGPCRILACCLPALLAKLRWGRLMLPRLYVAADALGTSPHDSARKHPRSRNRVRASADLVTVIQASSSLKKAAHKLGVSTKTVAKHARALGIRSQFRLGKERLPPDDRLKSMLLDAAKATGISALARSLKVTTTLLNTKAAELGVVGRREFRRGLPDDDTLRHMISNCSTMSKLAVGLGVADYHIRNQARRLNVKPGQEVHPRALETEVDRGRLATIERPSHGTDETRLAEVMELFNLASESLTESEEEREKFRLDKLRSDAEVEALRKQLAQMQQKIAAVSKVTQAPKTLSELLEYIATGLGSHVVVLPRAIKATRKVKDLDVERLYEALIFLRDTYVPMRTGGISKEEYAVRLQDTSFEEAASLSDSTKLSALGYDAVWQGRTITLSRHLKWGRDPKRLIRVYFYYCNNRKTVVVGWMPTHLDTSATN